MTRINSAKANAYDLHGKTFGELEVLNIAKNHPKDARGVYLIKGKYVAKNVFQKKAYYLGVCITAAVMTTVSQPKNSDSINLSPR